MKKNKCDFIPKIKIYIKEIYKPIEMIWQEDKMIVLLLFVNYLVRKIYIPIIAFITKRIIEIIEIANSIGFSLELQNKIIILFVLLFIPFALNRLWWPVNTYTQAIATTKLTNSIKKKIMVKICDTSLCFFDEEECYNIYENCIKESNGKRILEILQNLLNFIATIIMFILLAFPMFIFNPILSILLILSAIPGVIIEKIFAKKIFLHETNNTLLSRMIKYIFELFSNKQSVKEIKVFRIYDYLEKKHSEKYKEYNQGIKKLMQKSLIISLPAFFILQIMTLIGYYFTVTKVTNGSINIGEMSFIITAIGSLTVSFITISDAFNRTFTSNLYVQNLYKFYNHGYIEEMQGEDVVHMENNEISFKNVWFKYPNAKEYTLKNICLTIKESEFIALVGLNGAGKTTIIKLLLRLYKPTEGEILYNGIDISSFSIDKWREIFSVCFQDFFDYSLSLKEAIGIGNVNKIDLLANIKQAAEFAGLANVIDGLPMGYDTPLSREFDNEGVELSKGQKSKIAIARAFMSDGQILLFDEPTASLDARAENDYFESLKKLIRNKTCLIITHRLTSIKSVDRILVLSNGEIVEDGNHEALMRNKGFYFQLYETQSEKYMKLAKEGKNEKNYTI